MAWYDNMVKGEISYRLRSMTNSELLGWVDSNLLEQLDDSRLEDLTLHLQKRLTFRKRRWDGAIQTLSNGWRG